MTERDLSLKLKDGLRAQGLVCEQFMDQARGVKKPYDLVACTPSGLYWAIESKRVDIPSWTSEQAILTPRMFREHQLPSLLRVASLGGLASIALFVQPPRTADTRTWLISAPQLAARFRAGDVLRLQDLPADDTCELTRLVGVGWGLREPLLAALSDPDQDCLGLRDRIS